MRVLEQAIIKKGVVISHCQSLFEVRAGWLSCSCYFVVFDSWVLTRLASVKSLVRIPLQKLELEARSCDYMLSASQMLTGLAYVQSLLCILLPDA